MSAPRSEIISKKTK